MSQQNLQIDIELKNISNENETIEIEVESIEEDAQTDTNYSMIEPFDPIKINIQPKQDTLRNIIDRLRNDEIDMDTDFQRHADLWTPGQMSKLIESILIRFPLPAFYFDASDDNKWLIVDGLQRLSSIRRFVVDSDPEKNNNLEIKNKGLRLSSLDFLHDLKSKNYIELPRSYQRRIDECPVTLFLIQPGTPSQVKYSIFRRINTGGLVLNSQEIRNALARPREREFLKKLANDEFLIKTMGNQSKRMLDQELALRFISFYTNDYIKSPKNIAEFMDESMDQLKKLNSSELEKLSIAFKRSTKICFDIFGDAAFEKRLTGDQDKRKRKNTTLFEVWTVSLAKLADENAEKLIKNKSIIINKLQDMFDHDESFFRSISLATQKREHVKIRYERIQKIIHEVTL